MEMWLVIGGFAAVVVLYGAVQWAIDVRRERDHGSYSHWKNPVDPADNAGGASGQQASIGGGGGGEA
ncbi:hypothetical protein [Streptomyces peucetius]|uniref:Uncharacterized protein n=1 Tax=Streptomyces peucetius TaxID=1950 RepID=A0ABY6I2J5_STRPE|nr:hypothetical protein [Streptomyces peucetius]UYQ60092.1 hypothetical protein OGH68_00375 [Streptomyces peucetius]